MLQRFTFFFLFISINCLTAETLPSSPVLEYAQHHLPHCGVLKKTKNFIYVDITDAYIHQLLPLIEQDEFTIPPYFGHSGLVGAHISVIYPDEVIQYSIKEIEESETPIEFSLVNCQIVHPLSMRGIESVYLITLKAPKLDQIRKKYGLPEKRHDFHITVGVKRHIPLIALHLPLFAARPKDLSVIHL